MIFSTQDPFDTPFKRYRTESLLPQKHLDFLLRKTYALTTGQRAEA